VAAKGVCGINDQSVLAVANTARKQAERVTGAIENIFSVDQHADAGDTS
jgi:hypothetical protein